MNLVKRVCKYKLGDQPKESVYWQNKSYKVECPLCLENN